MTVLGNVVHIRVRAVGLALALLALGSLAGCSAFDRDRLAPLPSDGGPFDDGKLPSDGAAAGDGDGDGAGGAVHGCRAMLDPSRDCPQICDEECNGKDDDCDGVVDNGNQLCALPNANALCIDGECIITECEGRNLDCDNRVDNGCEASLDDVETCGGCNKTCEIDRALAGCENGECVVEQCDSGFDDCDEMDANGCEASLDTLENCGACDMPCALAGCAGGVCSAIACAAPAADCDGDGVDCEANIATDVPHCGACNSPCTFTAGVTTHASSFECVAMSCEPICDATFGDCDPDYGNGCETPINTLTHCGGCGVDCNALANTATTTCAAGNTCDITACDVGFDDCDGMAMTGCETDIRSITDCGGCSNMDANQVCMGLANTTSTSCSSGTCAITTCASGWTDCDGDVSNGCERNTALDGPCFPDTNCTRRVLGANAYYFCTNDVTWSVARDRCRTQRLGNLVHIDDAAENDFVQMYKVADSWIGATDALEGTWRWINDGVPFWRGLGSGSAVLSQYAHWASNQPDDYMGNEDCAEVPAGGAWNDQNCAATRDFVCEEAPDLCPADPSKLDPGQCGCGVPDADPDNDGFATCN